MEYIGRLAELAAETAGVMLALWWAWESFKALCGVEYSDETGKED